MKVLIACEFSGVVREAFRKLGHDAWSCDLLPTEIPGQHLQGDVFQYISPGFEWDLMIAHPPCTNLAGSGARWLKDHWVKKKSSPEGGYWHNGADKRAAQARDVEFVKFLWHANIPRIAIENPTGMLPRLWRKWDQRIQPYEYGHGETKATYLWLKNLPQLVPTDIVEGREGRVWKEPPSADRWKNRSRTYQGIADAMAEQWGGGEEMMKYECD